MTARDRHRADIELEVDRLVGESTRVGLREHLLAYILSEQMLPIDVRCPRCLTILEVIAFPDRNGATISCACGTCSGTMRGL
jgi:hypothetical protein